MHKDLDVIHLVWIHAFELKMLIHYTSSSISMCFKKYKRNLWELPTKWGKCYNKNKPSRKPNKNERSKKIKIKLSHSLHNNTSHGQISLERNHENVGANRSLDTTQWIVPILGTGVRYW